jgi:redox-sensitive bicupin YhaK (pirin superfamily)
VITIRRSHERGKAAFAWLDSRHTFSFGDYYDPKHMGFSHLRVINEDRVIPGGGFPTHSHHDMEIITYVLEGSLAHKDSTGTSSIIRVGDVQRMSAGTGISHSEYNVSKTEPVHFLQIWVIPNQTGLEPGYEQRAFPLDEHLGEWILIASKDGRDGSVIVHQNADLWAVHCTAGQRMTLQITPDHRAWAQIARGAVTLNGVSLTAGDGAAATEEATLSFQAVEDAEMLLFDFA